MAAPTEGTSDAFQLTGERAASASARSRCPGPSMPRSYYASASKAAQPASGYADSGVLKPAAEHNSGYADSRFLHPAAEHITLIESTEDMQTPALLNQDLAGWEPTPLQKDQARKLREVIDDITDEMNWARLQEISASSGIDATFADIDWSSMLRSIWQEASHSTQRRFTTCWSLEDWQELLSLHGLVSVDDLSQYIQHWASEDPNVGHGVDGVRAVTKPTADLGGWLADYVYTCFRVLSGQAKSTVRFHVLPNKLYGSLFQLLSKANRNNVYAGNVLEHLCWHAYKQTRGVFVLAIVWHTTNRSLPEPSSENSTATVNTLQLEPHVQPRNVSNIKKDIFAPLNAKCVCVERRHEQIDSSCKRRSADIHL